MQGGLAQYQSGKGGKNYPKALEQINEDDPKHRFFQYLADKKKAEQRKSVISDNPNSTESV